MCGGVGSRFWPFSRTDKPKQFLDFFGTGRTLLQMTVDRILPVIPVENIVLVTNENYAPIVREQLPELPQSNVLTEPSRRNTAPCVCWAAHHIYALDPEAVIITLPSDHLIIKEEEFRRTIEQTMSFAEKSGGLVTLGIQPNSPHTGYGYIQRGKPVDGYADIMKVKSFTEKPDEEMAKVFVSTGEFFWNAGIFIWTAEAILKAFDKYAPEMAASFNSGDSCYATCNEMDFIRQIFPKVTSISIDYAIMEKADNVYVRTADIGWSDLGTWKALYETSPRNSEGNVTQNCKVLADKCTNNVFATSGDKIIVAVGLDGYIVAENDNALLICPIKDEQSVKQLVNQVKSVFGEEYI